MLKCLGVTSCPPCRTPYTRDVTIFYISTLSMLFDIFDQSCWQSCATPVEIRVDVLALCIHFFYCVVFDVFLKMAENEDRFLGNIANNYVYMQFLTLLAEISARFLVS